MLKMRESILLKGCRENCEDGLIYGTNYAVVMDGATGLNKHNVTKYATDAQWLTYRTLELLEGVITNENMELTKILKVIAAILQGEYKALWKKSGLSIQDIEYPSAGLIVIRELKDKIQLYRLGDCLCVVKGINENIVLKDTELLKLDRQVHNTLVKVSKEKGIAISESRYTEEVIDVLKYNRSLKNKSNGYWIFDPLGIGVNKGEYIEINKEEVKSIYIMTDGLSNAIDVYNIYENEGSLINSIDIIKLHRVVNNLSNIQDEDEFCSKYIRTKKSDDIAAIVIDIG